MEKNCTFVNEFHIFTLSTKTGLKVILFAAFLFMYVTVVAVNSAVITLIGKDQHLHTPLYLFLSNLSIVDIFSTTVVIPNLLYMLLSGNNTIPLKLCYLQMYFFFLSGGSEELILLSMAYDRYVAICRPLHYHHTFSRNTCAMFVAAIWSASFLNSLLFTMAAANLSFCHLNNVHQFYCDAKALADIAYGGSDMFHLATYLEIVFFGLPTFIGNLASYVKMVSVIMMIKSKDGRRKAFSTCSSHLTVVLLYYTTIVSVYMMPSSAGATSLDMAFLVWFTAVTPVLNPLIYCLRNQDVKRAFYRQVGVKKDS